MYYDVVIVGAGPCGLAAAARLCERTPSALFTHDEHSRYWSRHNRKETIENEDRQRRKTSTDSGYSSATDASSERPGPKPSLVVLDAMSNQWMSSWRLKFQNLHITHLRSPLFFHPDPRDRDGLLAFAHEQSRTGELTEIANVVGKELSKHGQKLHRKKRSVTQVARHLQIDGRDKIDYFTPSTDLFEDYCNTVIHRYKLENLIQQANVHDLEYGHEVSPRGYPLFTIRTSVGTFLARNVVIATSAGTKPSIPPSCCSLAIDRMPADGISHVFTTTYVPSFLPPHTLSRLRSNIETTILVIGGGLTSAQLIHHFLTSTTIPNTQKLKIHLLIRSSFLKIKPFDVDISWVTKTRNQKMAEFWSAETDEERVTMLREARNGGSITPGFHKIVQQYVDEGRVIVHNGTRLTIDETCDWDTFEKAWTKLNVEPPIEDLPAVSHVIFATGATTDVERVDYLKGLRTEFPIRSMGGLPVLNDDLMWNDEVPLFFTGALAALRLGPGAANLMGARIGAERIAWKMEEILDFGGSTRTASRKVATEDGGKRKPPSGSASGQSDIYKAGTGSRERGVYTGSFANQFELLGIE